MFEEEHQVEKVHEETPLKCSSAGVWKYNAVSRRLSEFQYEFTSELDRLAIFRDYAQLTLLIPFVIILVPLLLIIALMWACGTCCWRKIGTTFAYRQTTFNKSFVERLLAEVGHYVPPIWYNHHLGTCIPMGSSPSLKFEREMYFHGDGSQFACDWYPYAPCNHELNGNKERLVCLYLCGLGLSSDANVAQIFARNITSRYDIPTCCGIIVPRGHPTSGIPLSTPKLWHGACTDDVKLILEELRITSSLKGESCKVFITGFSASSNIVVMTLADLSSSHSHYFHCENSDSPMEIVGAMLVAANYDYASSMKALECNFIGSIYSRLFVKQFKEFLNMNQHMHERISGIQTLMSCEMISEYDKAAFKIYGYDSIDSYYSRLRPKDILHKIGVPMVTIVGADDPLYLYSHGSVRDGIDLEHYTNNKNIIFIEPSHGNHFGFCDGSIFEIFTNQTSYLYPPKVAKVLLDMILERRGKRRYAYEIQNESCSLASSIELDTTNEYKGEDVEVNAALVDSGDAQYILETSYYTTELENDSKS